MKPGILIAVNSTLTLGGIFLGFSLGWNSPGLIEIHQPHWAGLSTALTDFRTILVNNLGVIGFALLGAITFGALPLATVFWNGLFIGFNLPAIFERGSDEFVYIASYLPVELLGICIAASVGESIGWWFFRSLKNDDEPGYEYWESAVKLLLASAVLILVAAGLETIAKILRNYGN